MADFDAIVIGAGHNGLTAAALLQQCRAAHALPRLQAVRRRDGVDGGTVRRLQVRDRRLGADSDVSDGEPRTRARRSAHRRPRRDVGIPARRRRRPARLLHRPDEADDAHQRGARRGGGQRDGRPDGLVPGADAGAGAFRRGPASEDARRDVRLRNKRIRAFDDHRSAVRVGHRCARPLPAGQGEARRAARHAVATGGATPPIAGPRLPAPPRRWLMGSPSPTRTRYWSRSCAAASARSRRTCKTCSPPTAASCGCAARSTRSSSPTSGSPGSASRTARRSPRRSSSPRIAPDLTITRLVDGARGACRHQGTVLPRRPSRQLPADALRA